MYIIRVLSILIFLAGCAKPGTVITKLDPQPDTCQTDTARPDYLSNSTWTLCWDEKGRLIGMVSGSGTTLGKVIMGNLGDVLQGAAVVGGSIGASGASD